MTIHWCGACHKECDVHVVDEGIGHYEFWGAKGIDTRLALETDCCEDVAYENEECTVECSAEEYASEAKEEAAMARWDARKEDDW